MRRLITLEAAKMMYERDESEYYTAKRKAARHQGVNFRYSPSDLPSNSEIRSEILKQACFFEGEGRFRKLRDMRLFSLWLMDKLQAFSPKLIGSTLTGHIRKGSDIDVHLFADSLALVTQSLDGYGMQYEVERKRVVKYNEERIFIHIHLHGRFEVEITLYSRDYINYRFKSSITGKAMENATLRELRQFLMKEYPGIDLEWELQRYETEVGCYEMFKILLLPLENVNGGKHHPEGDTLYHSLQVFELARSEGYAQDVEFLQAALLHDVGKAIDRQYHAEAGADALEGVVSPRVEFLIRYHMDALKLQQGTLGHRKAIRLRQSEYFDDLMALRNFDNRGRERGFFVDDVNDALEYLRGLESEYQGIS